MMKLPPYPGFKAPTQGFWLFAYGSLMWRPDFPFAERRPAVLQGYQRALCVLSWVYRGTRDKPGLVFGLDRGGVTKGVAFRIRDRDARAVYAGIYAREMPTKVYRPTWLPVRFEGGRRPGVHALAFVADRTNPQYAGRMSDSARARLIAQGVGNNGPCIDYIVNTVDCLRQHGIRDRSLERIVGKLG